MRFFFLICFIFPLFCRGVALPPVWLLVEKDTKKVLQVLRKPVKPEFLNPNESVYVIKKGFEGLVLLANPYEFSGLEAKIILNSEDEVVGLETNLESLSPLTATECYGVFSDKKTIH